MYYVHVYGHACVILTYQLLRHPPNLIARLEVLPKILQETEIKSITFTRASSTSVLPITLQQRLYNSVLLRKFNCVYCIFTITTGAKARWITDIHTLYVRLDSVCKLQLNGVPHLSQNFLTQSFIKQSCIHSVSVFCDGNMNKLVTSKTLKPPLFRQHSRACAIHAVMINMIRELV